MDFHHKDPSTKVFEIGSKGYKYSLEKLKEEVAKCDVVCANCHRKIHNALRFEKLTAGF